MVSAEQAKAVIETYLSSLVSSDLDAVVALYAEDGSVEDPVGTSAHIGHDAIRAFYGASIESIVKADLLGPVRVAAAEAAFPFYIEIATAKGGMRFEVIDTFAFNDAGKITHMRAFWSTDNMHMLG